MPATKATTGSSSAPRTALPATISTRGIQDPIIGNDVLIGGGGFDEFIGEGGDDIMVGGEGEDHFDGGSGFDWGTYKFDRFGVTVDMLVSDLFEPPVAPSNAGILDRFAFTEGLSGSAFGDFLRGDDADAAEIADTPAPRAACSPTSLSSTVCRTSSAPA